MITDLWTLPNIVAAIVSGVTFGPALARVIVWLQRRPVTPVSLGWTIGLISAWWILWLYAGQVLAAFWQNDYLWERIVGRGGLFIVASLVLGATVYLVLRRRR